ncbi:MAG: hypothetical protein O7J95_16855 [Planctomycetota bacterium]|nr:hypothetical protein [Planctomycetota bacterium]
MFFRPLLPYEMEVTSPAKGTTLRRTVLLPNEAPLLSFDVTRAAFVEKQTTLEFENGVLRRFSVKKPSQALALAGVPLEIARALASLPAEILKLRVDYSTKDAELAEARAAWFEAQSALRAARAATRPAASGDPMR